MGKDVFVVNVIYDGERGEALAVFSSKERATKFILNQIEGRIKRSISENEMTSILSDIMQKDMFSGVPCAKALSNQPELSDLRNQLQWVEWEVSVHQIDEEN